MKNTYTIQHFGFLILFPFFFTKSHSQDILWEKTLGGKQADYLMDLVPTADYGFILAGSSLSVKSGNKSHNNSGDLDYWIWKMKEDGNLDWQKSIGGSGSDLLQSVSMTSDGGFILGGVSSSLGMTKEGKKDGDKIDACRGGNDFWIVKLNAKGDQQWQKTIGGIGQENLQSIQQTKEGGYIIGGSSDSNKSSEKTSNCFGNMDYWIIKLDPTGKIEWQKTFGGVYLDLLRSIEQTKDGGYIVGGYSNSPSSGNKLDNTRGDGDYWVLRLDSKGQEIWQKTIGGKQDDQLYVVHQTQDGNFILGGNSNSSPSHEKNTTNQDGIDFWVLKLDPDGIIIWQHSYSAGSVDLLTSLVENKDSTLLIGGFIKGEPKQTKNKGGLLLNNGAPSTDIAALKEEGKNKARELIDENIKKGEAKAAKIAPSDNKTFNLIKDKVKDELKETIKNNLENTLSSLDGSSDKSSKLSVPSIKSGTGDFVALKISVDGEELWRKSLETDGDDVLKKAIETRDGGYVLAGTTLSEKSNGGADFWIVKLKDAMKLTEDKAVIEAVPNPTSAFTNVIVGYDFDKGTASVHDLMGRQLQEFAVTSRTVPIDLSQLPEGIYIVTISANNQTNSIKVIRGINKNNN